MAIEFSAAMNLPLGNSASLLLTTDLNDDGNLDILTDYVESGSSRKAGVALFLGTGGGQFAAAQRYAIEKVEVISISTFTFPIYSAKMATGDVDRDGKLDLIAIGTTGSQQGSIVSVLKGTGSGFSEAINSSITALSEYPGGLVVADFNRDNNLDVAAISNGNTSSSSITSASKQQVSILLGDGAGKFGNEKQIALGFDTSDIVSADFNGDGFPDLVVAGQVRDFSYSGSSAKRSILLSDGKGGFSAPNTVPNNLEGALFAADLNGDGKLDLGAVGNGFLPGEGNGQFKALQSFYYVEGDAVALGDFNGDGKLDIAGHQSGGYGPGTIGILLGDGKGNYTLPATAKTSGSSRAIVSGDFDQDGKLDIAAFNYTSESIAVFFNRSIGSNGLVIGDKTIDASIESGALTLDLKKGTLQIGNTSKALNGSYRTIRGTQQNDRITGGKLGGLIDALAGNDVIVGGDSNDELIGGLGNDTLAGGKGKDTFAFSYDGTIAIWGGDQVMPFDRAMGVDKIIDFEINRDKIGLYRNTFTAFPNRRMSFASVKTKKEAQRSKSLITYIPKTGSLFYNQNGAKAGFGAGGQFADLTNGLELRAKDFVLF